MLACTGKVHCGFFDLFAGTGFPGLAFIIVDTAMRMLAFFPVAGVCVMADVALVELPVAKLAVENNVHSGLVQLNHTVPLLLVNVADVICAEENFMRRRQN